MPVLSPLFFRALASYLADCPRGALCFPPSGLGGGLHLSLFPLDRPPFSQGHDRAFGPYVVVALKAANQKI